MVWTSIDSIADGMYRRVCPLYSFDHREHLHVVGSAVPFNSGGFRFLLSAAPVCLYEVRQPTPLLTFGNERLWPLTGIRGVWEYEAKQAPDVDIAVITLSDECADDLEAFYQFSTPRDVASPLPKSAVTHFLIAGYPASRNRFRSLRHGFPSRATFFVMRDVLDLSCLKLTDKVDQLHFALSVPTSPLPKVGGGKFHLPQPHGMSGGGIWRFEVDPHARLVTTPLLVGISIEYHKHERALLATRVQAAIPLARDLFTMQRTPVLNVRK